MNVVGRVGSFITQGMYSVATPFHPFGGAVDIIAVKQQDGTFRSTPWYVRFGKFQGVLKGSEKVVRIEVNGVEANFNMHLDNSGEAYFVREVDPTEDGGEGFKDSDNQDVRNEEFRNNFNNNLEDDTDEGRDRLSTFGKEQLEGVESDSERMFYEFQDEQSSLEGSVEYSEYGSSRYDNLDSVERALESQTSSEVVLVSVDGHILTAPISSSERSAENVQFSTPQFHLGPGEATEEYNRGKASWTSGYLNELDASEHMSSDEKMGMENYENLSSGDLLEHSEGDEKHVTHAQETQALFYQGKEVSTEISSKDDISGNMKKTEVFQSCLEFSELMGESSINDRETVGSSVNITEAGDDSNEKIPPRPLIDDETEEGKFGLSKNGKELSPHESDKSGIGTLTGLMVEVSCHERVDYIIEQSDGNNQDPQSQVDSDAIVREIQNGNESLVSEDELGRSIEPHTGSVNSVENMKSDSFSRLEISLCGNFLHPGMGVTAAENAFNANEISLEEFRHSGASIMKNENLIVRVQGKYIPWNKASHIVLGLAAFGLNLSIDPCDAIPVEQEKLEPKIDESSPMTPTQSRRWRLWPMPFRRVKPLEHSISTSSNEDVFVDSDSASQSQLEVKTPASLVSTSSPRKQIIKTHVPTTDQIASLNLKEGQNMVNFIFNTRVLGVQKVEAHIYLWRWNTKIVISDVDGTITKSDVLGQFMPLVGKDWTHSGIARLFSAIKENGYQLLFLSARAIVQAYLTKSFLFNLKQDGKSLPNGPVVISPDGLFPSLYREVIRRAPHEFKIACLEDIKALFPPDYNPFYAGFGNRDTDELSYRKIGIPKGKIFIINPKGEVAINHRIDVKSYTSLHTLVHDMFPPTSLVEQEDYNSWNYWKMPLPDIDDLQEIK